MKEISKLPYWKTIHTIIFDFDGIFTNNKVYLMENGMESIQCSRGDGLGINLLRKFMLKNQWELRYFILSKEKNPVVERRSKKIKIDCFQGIDNKLDFIKDFYENNKYNEKDFKKGFIYLGNDLNDLEVFLFAKHTYAPYDSHPLIKKNSKIVSSHKGGEDFVRFFIEELIELKKMPKNEIFDLLN